MIKQTIIFQSSDAISQKEKNEIVPVSLIVAHSRYHPDDHHRVRRDPENRSHRIRRNPCPSHRDEITRHEHRDGNKQQTAFLHDDDDSSGASSPSPLIRNRSPAPFSITIGPPISSSGRGITFQPSICNKPAAFLTWNNVISRTFHLFLAKSISPNRRLSILILTHVTDFV